MKFYNIVKDDMLNGDGVRAILFVSGCTHHCPECHNPITWNKNGGVEFNEVAKAELFAELDKSYVSGITFSGGDPLATFNRDEVLDLIKEIKEKYPDKTVWVYSGYTKNELIEQGFWDKLALHIDVIVEGKFEIAKLDINYNWAGSTNQRILRKESGFTINTSNPIYQLLCSFKDELNYLNLPDKHKEIISNQLDMLCIPKYLDSPSAAHEIEFVVKNIPLVFNTMSINDDVQHDFNKSFSEFSIKLNKVLAPYIEETVQEMQSLDMDEKEIC